MLGVPSAASRSSTCEYMVTNVGAHRARGHHLATSSSSPITAGSDQLALQQPRETHVIEFGERALEALEDVRAVRIARC